MRISNLNFTNNFINQVQTLQQNQTALQQQASSGLSLTSPEDNPSVMAEVLNLQAQSAANTQYQSNINHLQSAATNAATGLNSLQTIVSQADEIATNASSGTTSPTQLTSYAAQVSALIQQALQVANTQDSGGNYIFSGAKTGIKPFNATTDSNGNVTAVTYAGDPDVNQAQIGPNTSVTVAIPGANTTGSGADGLFTDSRTGADLFNHLISLQQNLASGSTSAISSTDMPNLTKDENNVVNQISANGVAQSALTAASNVASARATDFATQISNDTSVNMAQTLTNLTQTQTAYQAALESGAMVMQTSLLNYIH